MHMHTPFGFFFCVFHLRRGFLDCFHELFVANQLDRLLSGVSLSLTYADVC
jgi:hypothetical protein